LSRDALIRTSPAKFREYGARALAQDRFITKHYSPSIGWIAIGVLLVLVIGLLAT
jgi:hypothetical protein